MDNILHCHVTQFSALLIWIWLSIKHNSSCFFFHKPTKHTQKSGLSTSNAFRKLRAAATGSAIASMQPMSYKDTDTTGEPVEHVTEPDKQIAHSALGDYGPFSVKYATKDFLSYGNKKFRI